MNVRYETRIRGHLDAVCESLSCALSHVEPAFLRCMVSIQGCSFYADHVTEENLYAEIERAGKLDFEYGDEYNIGMPISISKVTRQ